MDNITTLAGTFASHVELQQYADVQYKLLQKAHDKIALLEAEIVHLKSIVTSSQPLLSAPSELIIKSTEQAICEMQIERLKEASMNRNLTLEETKRLDLLVKNLILAKEANKEIKPDYKYLPEGITEATLISIAASGSSEESPASD